MQMVVSVNFRFLGRRKNNKVEITLTPMHSRSRRGRNRSMFSWSSSAATTCRFEPRNVQSGQSTP